MAIEVDPSLPTGVAVSLSTLWLNDALDPTDRICFPLMDQWKVTSAQAGEVRAMASGRQRLVLTPGPAVIRRASASLPWSSREQVIWVEGHVARIVCVRDDSGRKFFATYLEPDVEEVKGHREYANISLELTEVTFSEAV